MRPGRRLLWFLALLCGFALLVPLAPALGYVLLLALAAALLAAGYEYARLTGIRFVLERPERVVVNLDENEALVQLLRHTAGFPVQFTVRQVFPRLVTPLSQTRNGLCLPGRDWKLEFNVRGLERGTQPLDAPVAAVTSWGLAERVATLGVPAELSVLPNLHAVNRLHQQLNASILRGLGARAAPRMGKGREFDRLREYHVNDDIRDIAWKASARHQKLIVREFRLDRSQDVLVCLDRGHRMASRTTTVTKIDHAVNATVLLGYICNRMEDRIGVLSFGSNVEQGLGQGRGPRHLRQLTSFVTQVRGEYIHTDYVALAAHVRRRLRHRALVLIMTDLPEGETQGALLRAVRSLSPPHLPLILVLSDPELQALAATVPEGQAELCRTLVAREVVDERQRLMRELRGLGAWVIETSPQDTGVTAVNQYLEIKRRQLI